MTAVLFSKGWFPVGQLLCFRPLPFKGQCACSPAQNSALVENAERQLIWIHMSPPRPSPLDKVC